MLKFFKIGTVILLITWMSLIFCLSHQNAATSSGTSGRLIKSVVEFFYSDFNNLSMEQQQEIIEPFQFIVRKTAHFTLYAVLGALSFLSLVTYKRPHLLWRSVFSAAICLIYAISDEIHQLFIDGRSGEIRDVFIDFAGSMLAITVLFLIVRFSKQKNISLTKA